MWKWWKVKKKSQYKVSIECLKIENTSVFVEAVDENEAKEIAKVRFEEINCQLQEYGEKNREFVAITNIEKIHKE